MPQPKKHSSVRARRNKASTRATLVAVDAPDYGAWSLAQLHAEIDLRNEGAVEADKLGKPKTKPACVTLLTYDDEEQIPELPDRTATFYDEETERWVEERELDGWHEQTRRWWRDVWTSPMSEEWHTATDFHNLVSAAMHYDDIWRARNPTDRQKADAAFVKRLAPLGLTPYDRRRLEWTIETADAARASGRRRRASEPPAVPTTQPTPGTPSDPRAHLSVAK